MLNKTEKRKIAQAVFDDKFGELTSEFAKSDNVLDFREIYDFFTTIASLYSFVGFAMNRAFDEIKEKTDGWDEFLRYVLTQPSNEYFRLIQIELYNQVNIENTLQSYILNEIDNLAL